MVSSRCYGNDCKTSTFRKNSNMPAIVQGRSGTRQKYLLTQFTLNQCDSSAIIERRTCGSAGGPAWQITRPGCDTVLQRFSTECRQRKMTQDVLDRFFADSITHLSQQQPQAASSFSPFSELVRQEGSRSLPVGSLPPLSTDGDSAD